MAASDAVATAFTDNANKALALLIDKVASGIDSATSFLAAQIPDVIHQLLVYNFVVSLGICLVSFVALIALPLVWYFSMRWAKRVIDCDAEEAMPLIVISGVILVFVEVFLIAAVVQHFDWLKIWLAPKIYLIQYAADLVKSFSGH